MDWKIAEAKQKFSDLVKAAEDEPQARTLGEAFDELRRICGEEDYSLEIPPRQERPNPFQESELLARINEGLPTRMADRYQELIGKRRAASLTSEEYAELLSLTDEVEGLDAERIKYLAELARLRKTSLTNLMAELGIQTPPNA